MPQLVGLFDVDQNLIISDRGGYVLNRELCLAYKWLGVTEGHFFTNHKIATLQAIHLESALRPENTPVSESILLRFRCKLREKLLSEYNLRINRIYTPRDLLYEKIITHRLNLFQALTEQGIAHDLSDQEIDASLHCQSRPAAFILGNYYLDVVAPLERTYLALATNQDEFINSAIFQNALKVDTLLDSYLEKTDPDFINETQPTVNNAKAQLFRRLIAAYGSDDLQRGINYIKNQEIIFVFSDDQTCYQESVQQIAQDLGLKDHLLVINTHKTVESFAARYLTQVKKQWPFIHFTIIQQEKLPTEITVENQYAQAWNFNCEAFKRLADKATNRRSLQGRSYSTSTTFNTELNEHASQLLKLKFLKLALLTRKGHNDFTQLQVTLKQEIARRNRLREIFITQQELAQIRASGYNLQTVLMNRFEECASPWVAFLNLADQIDQAILEGCDATALLRLALYHATCNAALPPAVGNQRPQIVEECFMQLNRLLREGSSEFSKVQQLQTDILRRSQRFSLAIDGPVTLSTLPQPPARPIVSNRTPQLIGLFDVDDNLVCYNPTQREYILNTELCLVYKLLGITQGMFFTSHGVSSIQATHDNFENNLLPNRLVLKERLRAYAINIAKVLTCTDIIYERILNHQIPNWPLCLQQFLARQEGGQTASVMTDAQINEFFRVPSQPIPPESFRAGLYYDTVIQHWEQAYRTNSDTGNFITSEPYKNAAKADEVLDHYWLTQDPNYYSKEPEANNMKYQLFRRLVMDYGANDLERGIRTIQEQNIVFVFSDDQERFCFSVKRAAEELGLSNHLLVINTANPEQDAEGRRQSVKMLPALYYLQQIMPQLQLLNLQCVRNIIHRQYHLPNVITVDNQILEAWRLNYRAFERLAEKAIDPKKRYSRQSFILRISTTFQTELGQATSVLLGLKFLKLAWLTRCDPYGELASIRPTLQEKIFHEPLYHIYRTQLQLSCLAASDEFNNQNTLLAKFQNSQWLPFLNLADKTIDDFILQTDAAGNAQGCDKIALFRLALYYAVIDAGNSHFVAPGYQEIIEKCFKRLIFLLTQSRLPEDRIAIPRVMTLRDEILKREHAHTLGCFDRWFARRRVALYAIYNIEPTVSGTTESTPLLP